MLEALGNPQGATPVKTDNATAASFFTDMIKQNYTYQSRRFPLSLTYWTLSSDCHTKYHPPSYCQKVRKLYNMLKGSHTNIHPCACKYDVHMRVYWYDNTSSVCTIYERLKLTQHKSVMSIS